MSHKVQFGKERTIEKDKDILEVAKKMGILR